MFDLFVTVRYPGKKSAVWFTGKVSETPVTRAQAEEDIAAIQRFMETKSDDLLVLYRPDGSELLFDANDLRDAVLTFQIKEAS